MDPISTSYLPSKYSLNSSELITENRNKSIESGIKQRLNHYANNVLSIFHPIVKDLPHYAKTIITQVSSISCVSYLCQKILGNSPLESYKVTNRVLPADEKLEPLIRDFFPKLKQNTMFHVWKRFCPRNEEEQINFLLHSFEKGTCFGQTLILLFLMETCAASSSDELSEELKKHYGEVLYFQALSEMLCEVKEIWLKKKGTREHETMKNEIEQIGGSGVLLGMSYRFFDHQPFFNSFSITDKGLRSMINIIEFWSKKIHQQRDTTKNNPLCIPVGLESFNDSDPSGHVVFVQLSPKHRLYDCMLPEMGFFEFSSERELLQFLPRYFKKYYSSLCKKVQLPFVFPPEDEKRTGVLIEVPVKVNN